PCSRWCWPVRARPRRRAPVSAVKAGARGSGERGSGGPGRGSGAPRAGAGRGGTGRARARASAKARGAPERGAATRGAANADWLRRNPRAKVELEGHCDSRGTIEYNLGLGARRAKSVKDALVAQGIGADRISTISYGEELPLCRDETEACWARNRRVHGVVLGQ